MAKKVIFGVRVNRTEQRAMKRYAKHEGCSVSDLMRQRVVTPAMAFDSKQTPLSLWEKEGSPHASRP